MERRQKDFIKSNISKTLFLGFFSKIDRREG
jgi:hypothetical protein